MRQRRSLLRRAACVLTRSAVEGHRPAQSRPLGLLKAWMDLGLRLHTKEEHWARVQDCQGGAELLECERPQRPGEGPEPEERP